MKLAVLIHTPDMAGVPGANTPRNLMWTCQPTVRSLCTVQATAVN